MLVGSAFFAADNAQCASTLQEAGMSGTITITQSSGTAISGSFDVMFQAVSSTGVISPNADHVTGTFTAPVCSAPTTDAGAAACGG